MLQPPVKINKSSSKPKCNHVPNSVKLALEKSSAYFRKHGCEKLQLLNAGSFVHVATVPIAFLHHPAGPGRLRRAHSDALAGAGNALFPHPTPILPAAAHLPPSTVVLSELGRRTAFSVRPPVPAPEPGAAALGNYPTGPLAENDGAGAVAGWLAGLGLGRYAEALLGAGWDCAEVRAARANAATFRAPLHVQLIAGGRRGSCPLSTVERRRGPALAGASRCLRVDIMIHCPCPCGQ